MNKYTSLRRAVLVTLALGALGATTAFADTTSTGTTTDTPAVSGDKHHHHDKGVLTEAERAQLKKDRDAAFAANPALKTQDDSLKAQFKTLKSQNPPATEAQKQALKTQKEALKTQLRAAILGVDSSASAIFAKLDAAKGQHKH